LAGLLAGVAVAGMFGWRRSRPLENLWQSGVIGVLAAVGALLVGFLAAVADRLLGFPGLIAWGVLSAVVGTAASRWSVAGATAWRSSRSSAAVTSPSTAPASSWVIRFST